MATSNRTSATARKPARTPRPATQEGASPFFRFNARYGILPGSSLDALRNDLRCFMDSGLEAIQTNHEGFDSTQWAGIHMLRMAYGLFEEIERRVDFMAIDRKVGASHE